MISTMAIITGVGFGYLLAYLYDTIFGEKQND